MLHLRTWLCEQWKGTIQLPNNLTTNSAKYPGHIWGIKDKRKISFMWEAEQTVPNNLRQLENQQGREKGALWTRQGRNSCLGGSDDNSNNNININNNLLHLLELCSWPSTSSISYLIFKWPVRKAQSSGHHFTNEEVGVHRGETVAQGHLSLLVLQSFSHFCPLFFP